MFVKQITSWGGHDVFKLDVSDSKILINNKKNNYESLTKLFKKKKYILQTSLIQHPELSRLNPNCINTIRVNTISNGEDIEILVSFLRIGKGESVVDNILSGNLFAGIDKNGKVYDKAIQLDFEPVYLSKHPTTDIPFGSITIPYYKDALELCIQLHRHFDYFFIIGWDIAITPDGPSVIEGNPVGELAGQQLLYGGMKEKLRHFAREFEIKKLPYIKPN